MNCASMSMNGVTAAPCAAEPAPIAAAAAPNLQLMVDNSEQALLDKIRDLTQTTLAAKQKITELEATVAKQETMINELGVAFGQDAEIVKLANDHLEQGANAERQLDDRIKSVDNDQGKLKVGLIVTGVGLVVASGLAGAAVAVAVEAGATVTTKVLAAGGGFAAFATGVAVTAKACASCNQKDKEH